jgi:hypothetical protein
MTRDDLDSGHMIRREYVIRLLETRFKFQTCSYDTNADLIQRLRFFLRYWR